MLSGFEMKSPRSRLSIRAELFRNFAKLIARGSSGSAYINLFSSRNANPDLGLVLKSVAPVRTSFFCDFMRVSSAAEMGDCVESLCENSTEGH